LTPVDNIHKTQLSVCFSFCFCIFSEAMSSKLLIKRVHYFISVYLHYTICLCYTTWSFVTLMQIEYNNNSSVYTPKLIQ